MPKREFLHEWMHRFEIAGKVSGRFTGRVWAQANGFSNTGEFGDQSVQIAAVSKGVIEANGSVDDVIAKLAELPFVNAVEIVGENGNGRLVYVDWP